MRASRRDTMAVEDKIPSKLLPQHTKGCEMTPEGRDCSIHIKAPRSVCDVEKVTRALPELSHPEGARCLQEKQTREKQTSLENQVMAWLVPLEGTSQES